MNTITRLITIIFLLGSFLANAQSNKRPIKLRIKSEGDGTNIIIDDDVSISLEEDADRILEELNLGRSGSKYVDKTIVIDDEDDLQDLIDELQDMVGNDADIFVDDQKLDDNSNNETIIIDNNRPVIVQNTRPSRSNGKPMLGVYLDESKKHDGAKLTSVTKNGAAERAGLRAGDLITAIDRNEIYSSKDLRDAKARYNPGDQVLIEYERNGRVYYTDLTFKSTSGNDNSSSSNGVIGNVLDQIKDVVSIYIDDDEDDDNDHTYYSGKPMLGVYLDESRGHNGARISSLTRNGAAQEAGLKGGDIITSIDDFEVRSSGDISRVKKNFHPGDRVLVEYRRSGRTYHTNLTLKGTSSSKSPSPSPSPSPSANIGRPMLGVYLDESNSHNGARLTSVTRNGAAQQAGLKGGDIITAIDNYDIRSSKDLTNAKKSYQPGDRIEVEYRRNGRVYSTDLVLKSTNSNFNIKVNPRVNVNPRVKVNPNVHVNVNTGKPMMGVYLSESNSRNGAAITSVTNNGAAQRAGLRKGDVIIAMDDREIFNSSDLRAAKKRFQPGDRILVEYKRDGRTYSTPLTFKSTNPNANISVAPRAPRAAPRANYPTPPRTPRRPANVYSGSQTAFLGVEMEALNPSLVDERNLDIDRGVYLTDVVDNSPADRAGLRRGDVITHLDGQEMVRTNDISNTIRSKRPGEEMEIVYFRRGEPRVADVRLATQSRNNNTVNGYNVIRREAAPATTNSSRKLVEETRPFLGVHFENSENGGVKVTHVESNSAASESGIVKGDVITGFEAELVGNDKQLTKLIAKQKAGDRVIIRYNRNNERRRTFATLQGKVESKWVDNSKINSTDLFGRIQTNTGYNLRRHLDSPDLDFNAFEFYPNPNQGRFRLSFNLRDAGDIGIQVYNSAGMVIHEEFLKPFENAFDKEIRLPYGTPPGIYLLYVNQGEQGMVKKMTVR